MDPSYPYGPSSFQQPLPTKRRPKKLGLVLLAFLALLIVGATIFLFSYKPSQDDGSSAASDVGRAAYLVTADKFMSYITSGDSENSYALLSKAYKMRQDSDSWQSQVKEAFGKGRSSWKFQSSEAVENPKATYGSVKPYWARYTVVIDGRDWSTSLVVLPEGNSWKIDEMQSYAL